MIPAMPIPTPIEMLIVEVLPPEVANSSCASLTRSVCSTIGNDGGEGVVGVLVGGVNGTVARGDETDTQGKLGGGANGGAEAGANGLGGEGATST